MSVIKQERWTAKGWIHPIEGGDDYEFTMKFLVRNVMNLDDDKMAEKLIEMTRKKINKVSAMANDFVVFKNKNKKSRFYPTLDEFGKLKIGIYVGDKK